MKTVFKTIFALLITVFLTSGYANAQFKGKVLPPPQHKVRIIFTGDLHSCADMYPYLSTFIKEKQQQAKKDHCGVITLDAGDISMGTLYALFYELYATEYRALAVMGYDAFVFGNHDFDPGLTSLGYMVYNSRILGHQLNPITEKPLQFPINITANITGSGNETFENALKYLQHTPYVIYTRGDVKVGVFGLLGKQAFSMSKVTKDLDYKDPIATAKTIVKTLKEKDVDFIVALSHSGAKLREASEDFALAKACPDIDLIISGHDHEAIFKPLKVGKTAIVSAGCNGKLVGEVELTKEADENPTAYTLSQVPTDIEREPAATRLFDTLDINLITLFNSRFHFAPDYTVIDNPKEIPMGPDSNGFYPLNYEIAKALYMESERDGRFFAEKEKLVAIVPSGVVRASLPSGEVTYQDVYNVVPLGKDTRSNPGYPLVLCYVTGKELKRICEVNASVAPTMEDAYLTFYNLTYTYNSKGVPFFRVKDVFVGGKKVENKELYPVVTDSFTASSLAMIEKKSCGLISIYPKDQNGKEIRNINKAVLSASGIEGFANTDLTGWLVYALYLREPVQLETLTTVQCEDKPSSAPWIYAILLGIAAVAIIVVLIWLIIKVIKKIVRKAKEKKKEVKHYGSK